MKKYLLVLAVLVFVVPSVVSASWWNPFSWSIFQRKQPVQQVQTVNPEITNNQDEEIQALQKQIDDLKKANSVKTLPAAKEIPKIAPVIVTPAVVSPQLKVEQTIPKPQAVSPSVSPTQTSPQIQAKTPLQVEETNKLKQDKLDEINEKIDELNSWYDKVHRNILLKESEVSEEEFKVRLQTLTSDYDFKYKALQEQWRQVQNGQINIQIQIPNLTPSSSNFVPCSGTGCGPSAHA